MTTNQTLTIANRMIQHITFCLNNNMNLSDMMDYCFQDFDMTNTEISDLFSKVFFANFKPAQFAK